MKVLCVLNPSSAGGAALERWPQVASLIESFGSQYELLAEKSPIDQQLLDRLNSCAPSEFCAVAGIGGDGTHSALINALMRFKAEFPDFVVPPYVLLPMGTGNDIAKSFGLTARENFFVSDLRRSVASIFYGADFSIDLGQFGDSYFVDAFTIGLDPQILRERNLAKGLMSRIPILKWFTRGYPIYAWSTGKSFLRHQPMQATVEVDGKPWYSGLALNIVINNTRIYGGEFDFCHDAYANDGLLDVAVFTGHRDYFAKYVLAIRHNPQGIKRLTKKINRSSTHTQGKRIHVALHAEEHAQLDGEELSTSASFKIGIVPSAIHIKIPVEPA